MSENIPRMNASSHSLRELPSTTADFKYNPLMPTHADFFKDSLSDIHLYNLDENSENFGDFIINFSDERREADGVDDDEIKNVEIDLRGQIFERLDNKPRKSSERFAESITTGSENSSVTADGPRSSLNESQPPQSTPSSEFSSQCGLTTRERIYDYINDSANARFKRILDACVTSSLAQNPTDPLYYMAHQMMRLNVCDVRELRGKLRRCETPDDEDAEMLGKNLKKMLHARIQEELKDGGLDISYERIKKWLLSGKHENFPGDFGMKEADLKNLLHSTLEEYFPERSNRNGDASKWLLSEIQEHLPRELE